MTERSPTYRNYNDKGAMCLTQFKRGADALGVLNTENGGGGTDSEFAKFGVGKSYKVRVKGVEDIMQYFGYSVYKKVNTFIAKNPSVRNDRGFVESNLTPWDKAAEYYFNKAKAAEESGAGEEVVKALRTEAFKFSGNERYVIGFVDLATGEDIVVDFSRDQAKAVYAIITKYKSKLEKLAFDLTKTGGTKASDTKVTLSPLIDLDEDLSEAERKHFDASIGKPFDTAKFDGLLFEADDKQQTENLVAAGFDITLIGLSIGANAGTNASTPKDDEAPPITGEAPALNF